MGAAGFVAAFQKIKDRYRKHAIAALALLLLLLLFGRDAKPVIVVVVFIILASFSTFYHNYFRSPINFELAKLFTVTAAVAYGAVAGVIVGALSVIISRALSGRFDQDTVTSLAAMAIIAVLANAFRTANIAVLGIALVFVYYLLILPFIFLFGENRMREAVYIGTNIAFNVILFINVAPFLIKVVG